MLLDGCCGLPSGHNNGLAQQALVVAGNQLASLCSEPPQAGTANAYLPSVVIPSGSKGGLLLALTPSHSPLPNFGELRDIGKLCLIRYLIGKTFGYIVIGKFMLHLWKCNVTLNLHDSGWLVFRFSSEADMLKVLRRCPYFVQGKPLVIKPMSSYFDFGKPDMSFVPVWIRFPNLLLEC
jgi:hypothetical protein